MKTLLFDRTISSLFMASGVVVEQKPGSPTTLAFCSRWSQKELKKNFKNEDVWKQCGRKESGQAGL